MNSNGKTISHIVAISKNYAIGRGNKLLWKLPKDMAHFKATTKNKSIIMGRKTYESIGRPLPYRENIILTRDSSYKVEGALIASSLEEAIAIAQSDEVMICGGSEIYKQSLEITDRIYLTKVEDIVSDADAFYPALDFTQWSVISSCNHPAENDTPSFEIQTLERRTP